jgi:phage tail-like protein
MTDALTTSSGSEIVPAGTMQAIDSLVANEFRVEINGELVSGVFRVSGLISFKLDVKATNALKRIYDPFKVTKMVQRDPLNVFNTWVRETFSADADIVRPTRDLTIVAVDDGVIVRRWLVRKAWISEISYTDFNSGSAEMIEETVTIQHEGIDDSFPLLEG